jgi:hypothetical protein
VITVKRIITHPLFIAAALLVSPIFILAYWLLVFLAVG